MNNEQIKLLTNAPILVHSRMSNELRLKVLFYRTHSGSEPVREWLQKLSREEKKTINW